MSQNSKYGFIDKTDKVVIPYQYDDVRGLKIVWQKYH
ncbi:WG repeat-containing protein [Moraxella bovoculi]